MVRRFTLPTRLRAARADRWRPGHVRHGPSLSTVVGVVALIVLAVTLLVMWLGPDGGPSRASPHASPSPQPNESTDGASGPGDDKATTSPSTPQAAPAPAAEVPGPDAVSATLRSAGGQVDVYRNTTYKDVQARVASGRPVVVLCRTEGPVSYFRGQASRVWGRVLVDGEPGWVPGAYLETGGDLGTLTHECP